MNNASYLSEFFGKLAVEAIKQEDECLIICNSKVSEYGKRKFYPKEAKFISKIDWCIKDYNPNKKEFGDLSWKQIFSAFDRFKSLNFSYENSVKMTSHLYQFFEFIFKEEKPDIVIAEPPAGLFHETVYYFCKNNNVPYIGVGSSRFDNKTDIYDSEFTLSEYEKTFKEIKEQDILKKEKEFAEDFVEKFVNHKHVPSYVGLAKIRLSQFSIAKHYIKKINELKPVWNYFLKRKLFKDFDYESEARLKRSLSAFFRMEKRQFKILLQQNIFSKMGKNDSNFFFFPLHYQPEASTSVWATYYSEQLSTIRNIAFSLPFPYKLYVKEHPASVGLREINFYKKLKKIPNVVLISPYENIQTIIEKSLGVITLTSTSGMEAALSGKPVYVLGNVFYSYHPFCRKIKNFEELGNKIREDLVKKPNANDLKNINTRFIISLLRNAIEGDIVLAGKEKDTNDYKLIYQNLKKYAVSKIS